jgi:cytochrome c biogenesis protein CcmG/thiol:disulfide interchange protein DsbE
MTGKQWGGAVALVVLVLGGLWTVREIQESRVGDGMASTQEVEDGDTDVVRLFNPVALEEFSITDLSGRRISSREWRGKVVLVNFWATWCPPCRAEIPDLIKLQNKYRDKIVIVGLSEDEGSVEGVKEFVREHEMNYPVAMTPPEIRKLFRGVAALPTTFVLDGEGRLVQKHVGQLNPPAIEREARVVAGLDTNVRIERVDSSDKVRVEHAAQAKNIPGVDLASLTDTQKKSVVDALLSEDCTCGCALTLAVCRLDDPTCPVSLPLAKAVVARYSGTSP